ncbi:MAG: hypothetical protein EOP49_45055 [Sphingobacteriales bacterium]|nr:MAG: hypothetical protein EOP49_45055 [Sphingobacteriales bacterium]
MMIGRPVKVLLLAGALNGLILPVALTIMLIAANKTSIVGDYKHPRWMTIAGALVVIAMTYIGLASLMTNFKF